jgi:predicted glycoside hydrolase/deacetylase ChbG (UPF0249 family)
MRKFLIVNADDFGLSEEISKGIITAHEKGIVTSTSVVANGKYCQEGIRLLKDRKLDVGVHLSFVGGERPLTGPIDGLVDESGFFYQGFKDVVPRVFTNRYDRKALRDELFEQVAQLRDAGIMLSHIDSHQHLHILPGIGEIVVEIAKKFDIRWIRLPRPGYASFFGLGMNVLSMILGHKLKNNRLNCADHFEGFERSGSMNEKTLAGIITNIKEGVTELIVHPGYDASADYDWEYGWETEMDALCSGNIKSLITEKEITLKRFSEIS